MEDLGINWELEEVNDMYDEPIEMINDMIEVVENSYLTVERTEKPSYHLWLLAYPEV